MNETIEPEWLDRGPGSGSLTWAEAMSDANPRRPSNDGRSMTRTTFYSDSSKSPTGGHRSWAELATIQDGVGHPDRSKHNHAADRRRIIGTLCSTLDCTTHQQDRTAHVVDEIANLREFYPTVPMEAIILGTISLVVDRDTTDFDNWIVHRDDFQSLMDDVDMDMSTLWNIREKLQQETSLSDSD